MNGALLLLLAYIAILVGMFMIQRKLAYLPDRQHTTPAAEGMGDMDVIHVTTADGLTLEGWYKKAEASKPTIIFFHGNAGGLRGRGFAGRRFLDAGYGFIYGEYRGFSGNPGHPSEQGLYKDARAYIDWAIHQAGISETHIVLDGESLGTGIAVHMAGEYPKAAAVVLNSPYTTLPNVAAIRYFWLPVRWLMLDRYDSLSRIGAITMPLLVLHGERDTIVPFAMGKTLYDAAPQPKEFAVYPEGTHFNLYESGGQARTIEFLEKHFKP